MAKNKNSKAQKTQALVVYQQKQQPAKKKNKARRKSRLGGVPAVVGSDSNARRYWAALSDPFSEAAVGARVVDQYSCHSTTYTLRATHTITADSSGIIGCWVLPNVAVSVLTTNGTASGFWPITYGADTTASPTDGAWGFDVNALSQRLESYRIVGMGARVTNLSAMTDNSGKFLLGSHPISSAFITKSMNFAGTSINTDAMLTRPYTLGSMGIPAGSTGLGIPALVNYPGTVVKSGMEMSQIEIDIIPRPATPQAFDFRQCDDSRMGVGINYSSAKTTVHEGNYLELNGFEASFICATGLKPSTSTIDVEIVYHIEGPPAIRSTTSLNAFVNAPSSASPVNFRGFFGALEAALKVPAVRNATHVGADYLHPLLGKAMRAIL